jgi:hypothetical protein
MENVEIIDDICENLLLIYGVCEKRAANSRKL